MATAAEVTEKLHGLMTGRFTDKFGNSSRISDEDNVIGVEYDDELFFVQVTKAE